MSWQQFRKEVREFLESLDAFLFVHSWKWWPLIMDDKDVGIFFTNMFKWSSSKKASISQWEAAMNIPTLVNYCNKYHKGFIRSDKISSKNSDYFEAKRSDRFVRSVAYAMDWQYVKDINYNHIFRKRWLQMNRLWLMKSEPISTYPYNYSWFNPFIKDWLQCFQSWLNTLLIPADWDHDPDLFIYA